MKTIKIATLVLGLLAFANVNAQERSQKDPKAAFERLDTDKDGKISLQEMEARDEKMKERDGDNTSKQPRDTKTMFTQKDTNSDGFIDYDEFSAKPPKKH